MIYRVLSFLCVFLFSSYAYADFGDLSFGAQLGLGNVVTQEDDPSVQSSELEFMVQPELGLRVGLLDWLHLDTGLGVFTFEGYTYPYADIGLTFALDVFTVVPEFKLGLFVWFLPDDGWRALPGADVGLAFRYHLDPSWSVALGWEFNVTMPPRYQGTLSFLYVVD